MTTICKIADLSEPFEVSTLVHGDCLEMLRSLRRRPLFDLVVTSPPYNLGKAYEPEHLALSEYLTWHENIIDEVIPRMRMGGSVCWQVGNYVENGTVEPLDMWLHPLFKNRDLRLRNRIVWR